MTGLQNTAFYQLSVYDWNNNPRYSPVKPAQLLAKVYPTLIKTGKPGECASISIPDIYIKLPELKPNKRGILVKKTDIYPCCYSGSYSLPEDLDMEQPVIDLAKHDEKAAHFKGSYLLISNRYDAPEQAVLRMQSDGKLKFFIEMQSRN